MMAYGTERMCARLPSETWRARLRERARSRAGMRDSPVSHTARPAYAPAHAPTLPRQRAAGALSLLRPQSGDCNMTWRESIGVACSGTGPRGPGEKWCDPSAEREEFASVITIASPEARMSDSRKSPPSWS